MFHALLNDDRIVPVHDATLTTIVSGGTYYTQDEYRLLPRDYTHVDVDLARASFAPATRLVRFASELTDTERAQLKFAQR